MSRGHHILTALRFSCEMASRKVAQVGFDGLADLMAKVWENTLCSELTKTAQEHKIMLHSKSYENGFLSYGFGTLRSKNIATVRSQISHSSSVPLIKQ